MEGAMQWVATLGVPLIIYVGAELVKRSTSIGSVKIDAQSKFLAQVQDALEKERARSERCDEARRRQDRRIGVLEYTIAHVSAESNMVAEMAEELATSLQEQGLQTESRRLVFSATKLRQLARKPEDADLEEIPIKGGIGSKDE